MNAPVDNRLKSPGRERRSPEWPPSSGVGFEGVLSGPRSGHEDLTDVLQVDILILFLLPRLRVFLYPFSGAARPAVIHHKLPIPADGSLLLS